MSRLTDERALRLYAAHVARRPRRAASALDALCREHPDLASSLRRLAQERSEARVEAPRVPGGAGAKLLRTARSRTRYVLLGEVARGGRGIGLRVWDTLLERPVAM